ncbi:hypothetical protein PVL29_024196 [Vitis rotundifolia]|uniref:8-oxoguanine DNA glycosylase N-terminal domain-containing protein n=1 Tax=Vitis rotundifolia TaxID=103349 RepID=A0AA38YRD3_VITRO|nr:hypothetical protein PVL29_024196 [Vitis rotundifolia]
MHSLKLPSTMKRRRPIPQPPSTLPTLSLVLTFPIGQIFRWKQTTPLQYTSVIGSHLISLKHLQNGDVAYLIHQSPSKENARSALLDFLNVGISLSEMWEVFKALNSRFAELTQHLGGARVLRQDPLECLFQFLCSLNNNIGRITKMVDFVLSLGNYLGSVGGFDFLQRKILEWLAYFREMDLQEVVDPLSILSGVGPKVVACIALFSLDQHHAIPVDKHVWQGFSNLIFKITFFKFSKNFKIPNLIFKMPSSKFKFPNLIFKIPFSK